MARFTLSSGPSKNTYSDSVSNAGMGLTCALKNNILHPIAFDEALGPLQNGISRRPPLCQFNQLDRDTRL